MAGRTPTGYGLEELRRDLRKKPEPVYVVEGEEALLATEAVQAIVDAVVPAAGRDFNLSSFSGDDETGRQFLAQAQSYPFMAEKRVVLVRRFEKMSLRDREEAAFFEYLKAPPASTVLVLIAAKLDRRTTLAKTLDQRARIVQANGLPEKELPGWVERRFAARGAEATEAAARRLVELAGPALLDLGNEIDKIVARYPDRRRIDTAEVEATVGQFRAEEVWAINRAFRPDDMTGFLRAFGRVLETDDEPVRLTALLLRHVNDLLRVRLLIDRGIRGPGAIAGRLRKPPWLVEQAIGQASRFTRAQLTLWLRNLQRADVQMKSLALPDRWVLERALLNSFLGREMA